MWADTEARRGAPSVAQQIPSPGVGTNGKAANCERGKPGDPGAPRDAAPGRSRRHCEEETPAARPLARARETVLAGKSRGPAWRQGSGTAGGAAAEPRAPAGASPPPAPRSPAARCSPSGAPSVPKGPPANRSAAGARCPEPWIRNVGRNLGWARFTVWLFGI